MFKRLDFVFTQNSELPLSCIGGTLLYHCFMTIMEVTVIDALTQKWNIRPTDQNNLQY